MKKININFKYFILITLIAFCAQFTLSNPTLDQLAHADSSDLETDQQESSEHSVLHKVILYIPNRVFDLIDIFRARIEVGPGLAAGARASKVAQAYVGTHSSVYFGLPGPRRSETIPLPFGLESHNGVALGPIDATANLWLGPEYSPTEVGATIHPFIFGIDFGIDPVEIADFAVGILGFDIRDDDI